MNRTNIFSTLKSLGMLVVGGVIVFVLQKPIEHWFNKYFDKKEISFEIISTLKLSRHEVQEYSKAEGFNSFNLKLDDLIVKDYHLVKIRLRNKGIPIKGDLKLLISIGNRYAKILDIKHRVKSPVNKRVPVLFTIPDLKWSANSVYEPELTWAAPIGYRNDGYNLYRSKFKDVGFGRVNATLIEDEYYRDSLIDTKDTFYYKVEAQKGIFRSGFSDRVVILPERRAFQALFEDAVWIDPDFRMEGFKSDSKKRVYRSLKEASEKESDATIFIIMKSRTEAKTTEDFSAILRKGTKVLYPDDLKFLLGETDIRLTSGLDEDAEIVFFFLFKIFPDGVVDFNLKLDGQPDISFEERSAPKLKNIVPKKTEGESTTIDKKKDEKRSITPSFATAFVGKNTIYVLWEHANDSLYKGVRIFRSEKDSMAELDSHLGPELYEGTGESKQLECILSGEKVKTVRVPEPPKGINFPNEPPRKKLAPRVGPSTPSGLGISVTYKANVINSDGQLYHFYSDNNVFPNKIYSYVLYAYDDNNNINSYPVVVNAALSDPSNNMVCNTVDIDESKTSHEIVIDTR